MRKNHVKRTNRDRLDTYDCAYIELLEGANTARAIVVPMKTVFINIAAGPETNVDRLFHEIEEAEAFFERWGVRFM